MKQWKERVPQPLSSGMNEAPHQRAQSEAASPLSSISLLLARWSAIKKREEREEMGGELTLVVCWLWAQQRQGNKPTKKTSHPLNLPLIYSIPFVFFLFKTNAALLSLSLFLFILFFSLCWLINWRAAVRERVKEVKGVVFGLASLGRKSITVYSVIKNLWFLWRRQWSCATKHTTSLPFQRKIKVFFFFSIQWSEMFVLLRWVGNKKIL